jgi:hypothetical protein
MPAEWRTVIQGFLTDANLIRTETAAALVLVAIDIGLLAAARLCFRRGRLILD